MVEKSILDQDNFDEDGNVIWCNINPMLEPYLFEFISYLHKRNNIPDHQVVGVEQEGDYIRFYRRDIGKQYRSVLCFVINTEHDEKFLLGDILEWLSWEHPNRQEYKTHYRPLNMMVVK